MVKDNQCPRIIRNDEHYPKNYCPIKSSNKRICKRFDYISCDLFQAFEAKIKKRSLIIVPTDDDKQNCFKCYSINQISFYCDMVLKNIENPKEKVCVEWDERGVLLCFGRGKANGVKKDGNSEKNREMEERAVLLSKFYAKRYNMTIGEFLSNLVYLYENGITESERYAQFNSEIKNVGQELRMIKDAKEKIELVDIKLYRKYLE